MSSSVNTPDFKTLFEAVPGRYLVFDPELRIVAVSDTYARATMKCREDIVGKGLFDVFPDNPNNPAAAGVRNLEASLRRVLLYRTADVMAVQKHDVRKPGEVGEFEERYWSVVNSPVFAADGSVSYIIHCVEDVTEFVRLQAASVDRSRLTESQRESEELLRLMADALPVLIAYVDADRRYRFTNAAYGDWFGLSRAACIGCHVREVLGEAAYEALRSRIDAALAGKPQSFEARLPYREAARDVLVNYVPHRNRSGGVVGFFALVQDVSERKRTEEALRDQGARLRAILDTAADAIITIDDHGIIQSVNPAAERLFGYAAAEMVGQNVKILMPPPFRDEHDEYLRRYRVTGQRHMIGIGREVTGKRRDGSTFPADLVVSEIPHLKLFTGVIRDITHRKDLEREVVEIASLEQRRIGQDLHDTVGQELTALNLLVGDLAESLRTNHASGMALVERMAAGLQRSLSELRAIMRGLLPVAVDTAGLMASLAELADRVHQQGKVTCTFECPEPVYVADNLTATHLYLIAQEAVHNALKHARPRSIRITLESNQVLILRVRDDGVGLPDRQAENSGLGLRIMRNRAAIIGATLTIEPAGPAGTLVTCTLVRK